jgi:tetratricopeptide (TPR) repeat protein
LQQLSVADVVKRSKDAVVQIVVSDGAGQESSLGSGFIVSADGKIVTNYHVIKRAHSAIAKLANGSFFPIDGVLAVDRERDLVLLKMAGTSLPFLSLSKDDSIRVGDHVVAIGSPLGFEGTVSDGIVSAVREEEAGKNWIQTTAPVSHGNSGGPLMDMDGHVVGVIAWGIDLKLGQNLNFAVPAGAVRSLLATLTQKIVSFESVQSIAPNTVGAEQTERKPGTMASATTAYESGEKALNSSHYEEAIQAFRESIHLDPDSARAWHSLGVAYFSLKQYDRAIECYKEAVNRDPKSATFWYSLGRTYTAQKQYSDALPVYQRVVGLKPDFVDGWYDFGRTYRELKNYEQATRAYREVTQLKPDYADAWFDLGYVLWTSQQIDAAVQAFRQVVHIKPDYSVAWSSLGKIFESIGRYDDAIAAYKNMKPAYGQAGQRWMELGDTFRSIKRYRDAVSAYKESVLVEPTNGYVWGKLGKAFMDIEDYNSAEEATKRSVDIFTAEFKGLKAPTPSDLFSGHDKRTIITGMLATTWLQLAEICDKLHKRREAAGYRRSAERAFDLMQSMH